MLRGWFDIVHLHWEYRVIGAPGDQRFIDVLRKALEASGYQVVYIDTEVRQTPFGAVREPSYGEILVHPRLLRSEPSPSTSAVAAPPQRHRASARSLD